MKPVVVLVLAILALGIGVVGLIMGVLSYVKAEDAEDTANTASRAATTAVETAEEATEAVATEETVRTLKLLQLATIPLPDPSLNCLINGNALGDTYPSTNSIRVHVAVQGMTPAAQYAKLQIEQPAGTFQDIFSIDDIPSAGSFPNNCAHATFHLTRGSAANQLVARYWATYYLANTNVNQTPPLTPIVVPAVPFPIPITNYGGSSFVQSPKSTSVLNIDFSQPFTLVLDNGAGTSSRVTFICYELVKPSPFA